VEDTPARNRVPATNVRRDMAEDLSQARAPIQEGMALVEHGRIAGFGAPGHNQGAAIPRGMRALLGKAVFKADVLAPKGADDRTESKLALQIAHEIAAEAWGADLCRFATGGSTESLHVVLAAVARPGDTVLLAQNCHKAEWAHALAAGLVPGFVAAAIDPDWDLETGVTPETLAAAFDRHPDAKAAVVVSPNYYGVALDIPALAQIAHARGVPLIVDAAWGGAFAFCDRLPADPLTQGADAQVCSVHKTMGSLAQGSAILANGGHIDLQRLSLAYQLFETTSPSVPILASVDAARREHALRGQTIWDGVLDLAHELRGEISGIAPLRVYGPVDLAAAGRLDVSKVVVDVSALGVSGYAVDDWLYGEHSISMGLSDARNIQAVISIGTTRDDIRRLVKGLRDLTERLAADPAMLPRAPADLPGIATLGHEAAMPGPDAFFADAEEVPFERTAGRIAAELIVPAPPGVPRLIPGQRISAEHVAWLIAHRDAGAFIMDPTDPSEQRIRCVARAAEPPTANAVEAEALLLG